MTTPEDPDTRSMELEVEVPGTPEEVWEAIATGPGITAWMHPTEVEEREGGTLSFDMGGDMQFTGKVAGWDPPHRFVEETEWKATEDEPPALLATEWLIEARSGGTCAVRMVTSGFGTGAGWDSEIEGFTEAMRAALEGRGPTSPTTGARTGPGCACSARGRARSTTSGVSSPGR